MFTISENRNYINIYFNLDDVKRKEYGKSILFTDC